VKIEITDEKTVTLYDEKGKPWEYEILDVFELDGNTYYGLLELPRKKFFSFFRYEEPVVMLKSISNNFGEALFEIEDKDEEERAFRELLSRGD
jgi:hypothetical protein